ncbi:WhiB family transcriptional regulator [Intrasporangium calvum]|uniref:WhiB family transcriptional regulator n=1 Tax=Intrasporangium calvum TaxID=53358 RepID=UPI001900BFB6|nr:WhiB family transcriptional regulator [Intrasporangium calvum]
MSSYDRGNRRGYGTPQRWVDRTGGPTLADLDPMRWHDRAACRDLPPSRWLDDYAQTSTSRGVAICRSCPVQRTCLASALVFGDEYGIYGGTTTTERAPLARRLRRGEPLGAVLDDTLSARPSSPRIAGAA